MQQIFLLILCVSIIIIGFFGNALVVLSIGCNKQLRISTMNLILVSLAIADLVNLQICLPETIRLIFDFGWIFGSVGCPIIRYLQVVSLYTSVLLQVLVCIERYFAICHPMMARRIAGPSRIIYCIVFIIAISMLFSTPYSLSERVPSLKSNDTFDCTIKVINQQYFQTFKIVEFFIFYIAALIVMTILYRKIAQRLWLRETLLQEGQHSPKCIENLRNRKNIVKMLYACVLSYFLCYSPLQIRFLLVRFTPLKIPLSRNLVLLVNLFALVNSAINPIMYSIFSRKLRERFIRVLCCKHGVKQSMLSTTLSSTPKRKLYLRTTTSHHQPNYQTIEYTRTLSLVSMPRRTISSSQEIQLLRQLANGDTITIGEAAHLIAHK